MSIIFAYIRHFKRYDWLHKQLNSNLNDYFENISNDPSNADSIILMSAGRVRYVLPSSYH